MNEPTIAPLRGALSVWGLTVDDIAVASFHGTGTTANDINESKVTNMQMEHLGRKKGNPLMVVCQKWLTGHPKGAAAAWMTNGLIQAMTTGKGELIRVFSVDQYFCFIQMTYRLNPFQLFNFFESP